MCHAVFMTVTQQSKASSVSTPQVAAKFVRGSTQRVTKEGRVGENFEFAAFFTHAVFQKLYKLVS